MFVLPRVPSACVDNRLCIGSKFSCSHLLGLPGFLLLACPVIVYVVSVVCLHLALEVMELAGPDWFCPGCSEYSQGVCVPGVCLELVM